MHAGCKKLEISTENCQITVHVQDGTEIDEDIDIMKFADQILSLRANMSPTKPELTDDEIIEGTANITILFSVIRVIN